MTSLLTVNGMQLEAVDEGTGTPVVFSHGSNSDIRFWEPQRTAFAATYRFVAFTRRYHGAGGPWPTDGDNSQDAHAEDLLGVLRRFDEPAHVVGFSTAIALRAALRDAAQFRTLTVIEPNVPWLIENTAAGESVISWWRQENERVQREGAGDLDRQAALWFDLVNNRGPGAFASQAPALRRMWLDNFSAARPPAPTPMPITCADLATINVPTLIIASEFGMPYSRAIAHALSHCLPQGVLRDLAGATHFASYQESNEFNAMVLAFIDQH